MDNTILVCCLLWRIDPWPGTAVHFRHPGLHVAPGQPARHRLGSQPIHVTCPFATRAQVRGMRGVPGSRGWYQF